MMIDTPAAPKLRQLRANPLVWSAVFLVFAGPLNPAAWLVWVLVDGTISRGDFALLAWTVLMPSTVVALVVLASIWWRQYFRELYLWRFALIGLFWGILAGPLGVLLGSNDAYTSLIEMINAYFIFLIFGTIFLIIPFFAVVFGLPCMFAVVAVGFLCSEPVD